jgi:hypothetical protein
MAEWGIAGKPSLEAFELLAQRLADEALQGDLSANHHQCSALVFIVLGRVDAAERELAAAKAKISAGGMDFSCWRYLNVSGDDMFVDIKAMLAAIDQGEAVVPPFLGNVLGTVH